MTGECPECPAGTIVLEGVTVTASRLPQIDYSNWASSFNPIMRNAGLKYKRGDKKWLQRAFKPSNKTISWTGKVEESQWSKDFRGAVGGIYVGVGGAMLAAFASPVLLEALGSSSFSFSGSFSVKAIVTRTVIEAGSQTLVNVVSNGASGWRDLDVTNVALSASGLNFVGSSIIGSTTRWTPFSQNSNSVSYLGNGITGGQAITGIGTSLFSGGQRSLMDKSSLNKGLVNMFDAFNHTKAKGVGETINKKVLNK